MTVKHAYNLANGSLLNMCTRDVFIPMSTSAAVALPTVTTKIVLLVFCAVGKGSRLTYYRLISFDFASWCQHKGELRAI